jgi:O-antigen/teichoic acid export membrane protein
MTSLASRYAAGDVRAFRRTVSRLALSAVFIGACGLLVGAVGGRPTLQLLYGAEYAKEAPTLRWIMAAGAAAYLASALSYAMIASRQLRIQPVILLVTLAVTLGLGLILIPRLGLTGAALAMVGGSIVQLLANPAIVLHVLARFPSAPACGASA